MGNKQAVSGSDPAVVPTHSTTSDVGAAWLTRQQCNDGYFEGADAADVADFLTPAEQKAAASGGELPVISRPPIVRWKRGELLGTGAFGRVFLALNEDDGTLMAAKQIMLLSGMANDELVSSLEQEVSLMARLSHPYIVQYLGCSRDRSDTGEDTLTIFMEFVPGGSISSLLRRFGKLNETLVRLYTRQILTGLAYLHAHGVVHRDVKGANILVDRSGETKLADFGASRSIGALDAAVGGAQSLRGTPAFMSPEAIRQAGVGRKSDIWSLGCTVIEMCTGRPPWGQFNDNPVSLMYAIATSNELPALPAGASEELHAFLKLCFARDPSQRPTAAALLRHPFIKGKASISASALADPTLVPPLASTTSVNASSNSAVIAEGGSTAWGRSSKASAPRGASVVVPAAGSEKSSAGDSGLRSSAVAPSRATGVGAGSHVNPYGRSTRARTTSPHRRDSIAAPHDTGHSAAATPLAAVAQQLSAQPASAVGGGGGWGVSSPAYVPSQGGYYRRGGSSSGNLPAEEHRQQLVPRSTGAASGIHSGSRGVFSNAFAARTLHTTPQQDAPVLAPTSPLNLASAPRSTGQELQPAQPAAAAVGKASTKAAAAFKDADLLADSDTEEPAAALLPASSAASRVASEPVTVLGIHGKRRDPHGLNETRAALPVVSSAVPGQQAAGSPPGATLAQVAATPVDAAGATSPKSILKWPFSMLLGSGGSGSTSPPSRQQSQFIPVAGATAAPANNSSPPQQQQQQPLSQPRGPAPPPAAAVVLPGIDDGLPSAAAVAASRIVVTPDADVVQAIQDTPIVVQSSPGDRAPTADTPHVVHKVRPRGSRGSGSSVSGAGHGPGPGSAAPVESSDDSRPRTLPAAVETDELSIMTAVRAAVEAEVRSTFARLLSRTGDNNFDFESVLNENHRLESARAAMQRRHPVQRRNTAQRAGGVGAAVRAMLVEEDEDDDDDESDADGHQGRAWPGRVSTTGRGRRPESAHVPPVQPARLSVLGTAEGGGRSSRLQPVPQQQEQQQKGMTGTELADAPASSSDERASQPPSSAVHAQSLQAPIWTPLALDAGPTPSSAGFAPPPLEDRVRTESLGEESRAAVSSQLDGNLASVQPLADSTAAAVPKVYAVSISLQGAAKAAGCQNVEIPATRPSPSIAPVVDCAAAPSTHVDGEVTSVTAVQAVPEEGKMRQPLEAAPDVSCEAPASAVFVDPVRASFIGIANGGLVDFDGEDDDPAASFAVTLPVGDAAGKLHGAQRGLLGSFSASPAQAGSSPGKFLSTGHTPLHNAALQSTASPNSGRSARVSLSSPADESVRHTAASGGSATRVPRSSFTSPAVADVGVSSGRSAGSGAKEVAGAPVVSGSRSARPSFTSTLSVVATAPVGSALLVAGGGSSRSPLGRPVGIIDESVSVVPATVTPRAVRHTPQVASGPTSMTPSAPVTVVRLSAPATADMAALGVMVPISAHSVCPAAGMGVPADGARPAAGGAQRAASVTSPAVGSPADVEVTAVMMQERLALVKAGTGRASVTASRALARQRSDGITGVAAAADASSGPPSATAAPAALGSTSGDGADFTLVLNCGDRTSPPAPDGAGSAPGLGALRSAIATPLQPAAFRPPLLRNIDSPESRRSTSDVDPSLFPAPLAVGSVVAPKTSVLVASVKLGPS